MSKFASSSSQPDLAPAPIAQSSLTCYRQEYLCSTLETIEPIASACNASRQTYGLLLGQSFLEYNIYDQSLQFTESCHEIGRQGESALAMSLRLRVTLLRSIVVEPLINESFGCIVQRADSTKLLDCVSLVSTCFVRRLILLSSYKSQQDYGWWLVGSRGSCKVSMEYFQIVLALSDQNTVQYNLF